ncbi:5758_t:CDS:2 [Diversispora eburnea]|uniref:5758_t:CDS:1 n=1 Tax=Diversispora eburnea TaxID=1213867 RepID=A0A9N8YKW0_9GLOM|nr:5758_t:CDS:2 [Diversispora eburnea]
MVAINSPDTLVVFDKSFDIQIPEFSLEAILTVSSKITVDKKIEKKQLTELSILAKDEKVEEYLNRGDESDLPLSYNCPAIINDVKRLKLEPLLQKEFRWLVNT